MSTSQTRIVSSRRRGALLIVAVAAAALLAGAALQSTPRPAVIASVDLERLFNSLEEQASADRAIQSMAEEMQVDGDRRRREVDELRDEQENFAVGSASHRELGGRIELAVLELRAIVEFNRQKIEARRADLIRGLYMKIRTAVAEIAARDGIHAVLLDDTIPALDRGDPNSVLQQISARRMIFCDPALDITDDVISFMNAKAAAAGNVR